MIKVVSKQTFRSEPRVNMTDNMIRVVLDMTRREWHVLKSHFLIIDEEKKND